MCHDDERVRKSRNRVQLNLSHVRAGLLLAIVAGIVFGVAFGMAVLVVMFTYRLRSDLLLLFIHCFSVAIIARYIANRYIALSVCSHPSVTRTHCVETAKQYQNTVAKPF